MKRHAFGVANQSPKIIANAPLFPFKEISFSVIQPQVVKVLLTTNAR
jgi:hypothetical protein